MKEATRERDLRDFIRRRDWEGLREFCEAAHHADIADLLADFDPPEVWDILRQLEPHVRTHIFSELDEDLQEKLIVSLPRHEFGRLIADMPPDDRVDLLKRLPEEKREAMLPAIAQAEREDIRRLSAYPEGTAGAVMTSEYAVLQPTLTAEEAIAKLRMEAPDKETIYYAYVVDEERRLIGFVSLKDLILAPPRTRVGEIMHGDVISALAADDQEEAARKIQKYNLIALPVVDEKGVLVGIITYDDALDVITQEQTEDMEKLMAIGGSHEAVYMKTSAWTHFKSRCGWIIALALLGLVSGYIVQSFEGILLQFAILATFMPMLADTGGNTGSQSATLVVRALALREISPADALRVLGKELLVALPLGLLLAGFAFVRVMFFAGSGIPPGVSPRLVGVAVGAALAIQVIVSTLIGAALPLVAARIRIDPAVVASPAITTIVDISGLLIFFTTAKFVLGL